MPILNYTTKVDVYKTVGEIQGNLVRNGAKKILTDYDDDGYIVALSFMVDTPSGLVPIRLPSNVSRVHAVLLRQKVKCDHAQAERVSWRIVKDWIEAQMAILESEMVTMDEIFLPYVVQKEQTHYEAFREKQLKLSEG